LARIIQILAPGLHPWIPTLWKGKQGQGGDKGSEGQEEKYGGHPKMSWHITMAQGSKGLIRPWWEKTGKRVGLTRGSIGIML